MHRSCFLGTNYTYRSTCLDSASDDFGTEYGKEGPSLPTMVSAGAASTATTRHASTNKAILFSRPPFRKSHPCFGGTNNLDWVWDHFFWDYGKRGAYLSNLTWARACLPKLCTQVFGNELLVLFVWLFVLPSENGPGQLFIQNEKVDTIRRK